MSVASVPSSVSQIVKLLIVAIALALLCAGKALGQETKGTLEGTLLTTDGQPAANVHVTVEGPSLLGVRNTLSSEEGSFRIPALPVGDYVVHFTRAGSRDLTVSDVQIRLGQTTTLGKLALSDDVSGVETIVITAKKLVDPVSTETGANLDAELLELLPIERDYREAIAYLPQANASYYGDTVNITGSSGTENGYFVDGVNVSEAYFGTDSTRLPQNFIQEVEVKTGGYEAEFGRSSGGIINVITKSGSNEFQNEAFGYFSNNNFAKDRRLGTFDLNRGDFSRYDVGLSLSGPIVRDKLWYFVAYDPTFERDELEVPGLGFYSDELVRHLFAAKLEWQVASSTRLTLLGLGDPTDQDQLGRFTFSIASPLASGLGNIDVWLGKVDRGGHSLSLNAQHVVGDRAILEATLSRTEGGYRIRPATQRGYDEPAFLDYNTNFMSGGYGVQLSWQTARNAAGFDATVYAGRHEVKAGVEYEDNVLDDEGSAFTGDGRPGLLGLQGTTYYQQAMRRDQEIRHKIPSVFLQDSWQATDRLRLNAGVRWDGLQIVDTTGQVVVEINDQLQPRTGFVYQLGELGTQKIFGSYGRFYEQIPTAASANFFGSMQYFVVRTQEDPRLNPSAVADTVVIRDGSTREAVQGLNGPHHDEFILGYERRVGESWRIQLRGVYKSLREALENSGTTDRLQITEVWGNPGKGDLSYLPRPKREYAGLELGLETTRPGKYHVGTSYVLSRNHGNYPGAFPSEGNTEPHFTPSFDAPQLFDVEGYLPNDRTHVFKLFGGYQTDFGLTVGGFFAWQGGTPRTAQGTLFNRSMRVLAGDRGALGRTPSIWDLNLRFAYDLPQLGVRGRPVRSRLLVDVFHLFSQREPVVFDNFMGDADAQTGEIISGRENPTFNEPIAYQPPMTIRLGWQTTF